MAQTPKKWTFEPWLKPTFDMQIFTCNRNNVKPNIDPKIIRPSEFHTESDCQNHKSREILQKIGTEIAFLLLKEYKVIKKPIVITSKGVSILE